MVITVFMFAHSSVGSRLASPYEHPNYALPMFPRSPYKFINTLVQARPLIP